MSDLGVKPTSTYKLTGVPDHARVIAHLSSYVPLRIWENVPAISNWLSAEMTGGLLDALESQIVAGNGAGEQFTGLVHAGAARPPSRGIPTSAPPSGRL